MINTSKILALISFALVASLLSACSDGAKKSGKGAVEILSDREAAPVTHALNRLQEPPAFPVDDGKRPFAVITDRDKRVPTGDKPLSLEESKPAK